MCTVWPQSRNVWISTGARSFSRHFSIDGKMCFWSVWMFQALLISYAVFYAVILTHFPPLLDLLTHAVSHPFSSYTQWEQKELTHMLYKNKFKKNTKKIKILFFHFRHIALFSSDDIVSPIFTPLYSLHRTTAL